MTAINSEDRAESLREIQDVIDCVMMGKKQLTFNDFKEITETICSDIFLCVIDYRYTA